MFDELSLGLAPFLVLNILEILEKLESEGLTLLLVEQNVGMARVTSSLASAHRFQRRFAMRRSVC